MDEYGKMQPRRHNRGGAKGKLLLVGVVIVIALIAGFIYLFGGGPINIGGPTTVSVNSAGTVIAIAGKSYSVTLGGYNNNTRTAYIYVSEVPVFMGPILNVSLPLNSTVKVNYNSQYAMVQMTLVSESKGLAAIRMAPLAASLQVMPDSQYIGHPAVALPGLQITVTTINYTPANAPTTTVASGQNATTTVKATTTVAASVTTTIKATNYTAQAIARAVKSDQNYGLMLNYTTLYQSSANCTPHSYNLTYFGQNGGAFPVPPVDFWNVTKETPYGMVNRTVMLVGNKYAVEFLPLVHDQAFNGTVSLQINVTVSSPGTSGALGLVTADNYKGIFQGASFSVLSSTYQQSKSINNGCGALVG